MSSTPETAVATATRIDGDDGRRMYETPEGQRYPSVTTILDVIAKPYLVDWAARVERELVINTVMDYWEQVEADTGRPLTGLAQALRLSADRLADRFVTQAEIDRFKRAVPSRFAFMNTLRLRLGTSRAHARKSARAKDLGSEAHDLVEWRLKSQLGILTERERPKPKFPEAVVALGKFDAWAAGAGFEPARVEFPVWSNQYGYAGTLDVVGELQHENRKVVAIGDWKTCRTRIYPTACMQVSAYVHALREMGHLPPELGPVWAFVCRLPQTADDNVEVRMVSPEEQVRHFAAFFAATTLSGWQAIFDPPHATKKATEAEPAAPPAGGEAA